MPRIDAGTGVGVSIHIGDGIAPAQQLFEVGAQLQFQVAERAAAVAGPAAVMQMIELESAFQRDTALPERMRAPHHSPLRVVAA